MKKEGKKKKAQQRRNGQEERYKKGIRRNKKEVRMEKECEKKILRRNTAFFPFYLFIAGFLGHASDSQ